MLFIVLINLSAMAVSNRKTLVFTLRLLSYCMIEKEQNISYGLDSADESIMGTTRL